MHPMRVGELVKQLQQHKKIIVIGSTGSGKSTIGKALALQLNLPFIELDDLYWMPNWQKNTLEVFRQNVTDATTQHSSWIAIGNYTQSITDILWSQASAVIWVKTNFFTNIQRLIKRCISASYNKYAICNGNQESIWRFLQVWSSKSILYWFLKNYWRRRKKYEILFEKFSHLSVYKLKN